MRKYCLCLLLCLTFLMACTGKEQEDRGRIYNVYGLNKDETKLVSKEYAAQSTKQETLIEELLGQLQTMPEKLEYKAPLSGNVKLLGYTVESGQLILNFDEQYKSQAVTAEVLGRAAVVRTMTQIKGIDYVSFQVKSEPLTDASGNVVGTMSADTFIDHAESGINSREKVKVRLYFANEEGDKLIETNRTVIYSSSANVSMEKLVLEQIIGGPSEQVKGKAFPAINPDTRIIGVTVKDGTCYVNLSDSFLAQNYNVTSEVTIYSIVNSLIELPNVNRVQIAINGDSNVMYREKFNLSVTYERNLDLVTAAE